MLRYKFNFTDTNQTQIVVGAGKDYVRTHDVKPEDKSFLNIVNKVRFQPEKSPTSAQVTLKTCADKNFGDMVEDVLDCFYLPLRVKVDFYYKYNSKKRYSV